MGGILSNVQLLAIRDYNWLLSGQIADYLFSNSAASLVTITIIHMDFRCELTNL